MRAYGAVLVVLATSSMVAGGSSAEGFSDGDFDDADWSVSTITFGNGGVSSGDRMPSGGSPNAYRQVTINVSAAPSPAEFSAVWSIPLRSGAVYDPSTQGAIVSIDYSEDARLFSGSAPAGQTVAPALRQGADFYIPAGMTVPETSWTAKPFSSLTESDFFLIQDDLIDADQHPDFSATGGPIEFGFGRGNSTAIGGAGFSTVTGIDDWLITIHPAQGVPLADFRGLMFLVLGLGVIGAYGSRAHMHAGTASR